MKLLLERFGSIPGHGTIGRMTGVDFECYTMERIWNNNAPGDSCVPRGTYQLEPHSTQAHPGVYALVNRDLGVSHYPESGIPRSAILIHSANFARELRGCIAPGSAISCSGELMVTNSVVTLARLKEILFNGENHTLEITWKTYE
jgi:hypothetical protein